MSGAAKRDPVQLAADVRSLSSSVRTAITYLELGLPTEASSCLVGALALVGEVDAGESYDERRAVAQEIAAAREREWQEAYTTRHETGS